MLDLTTILPPSIAISGIVAGVAVAKARASEVPELRKTLGEHAERLSALEAHVKDMAEDIRQIRGWCERHE